LRTKEIRRALLRGVFEFGADEQRIIDRRTTQSNLKSVPIEVPGLQFVVMTLRAQDFDVV
jgi:hypothetical protein